MIEKKETEVSESNSKKGEWLSYTMIEERMRQIYFRFYKETYKTSKIDRKSKELIAIAASLGFQCEGCLEGHVKKAVNTIVILLGLRSDKIRKIRCHV